METWWSYFAQSLEAGKPQSQTSEPELQEPQPTSGPRKQGQG